MRRSSRTPGQACAVSRSHEELRRSSLKEMMGSLVKWGMVGKRSGQIGEVWKVECNVTGQQRPE